jgi:hypothetical protein
MAVIPGLEIGNIELVVLIASFVLFIYIISKAAKMLVKIVWISVVSVIFPIFANNFLGFSFALDLNTFLLFAAAGIGLYFVFLVVKLVYSALTVTEKVGKAVTSPFRKNEVKDLKKKIKKMEEGNED